MYEYQYDPSRVQEPGYPCRGGHSIFRLALTVAGVAFLAAFVLGASFWVLGLAFHLVGLLFRIAFVVWLATMIWRHLIRPRRRHW